MLGLVRLSLTRPQEAARRVLEAGHNLWVGVQALMLVAVLEAFEYGLLTGGRLELPTLGATVRIAPLAYALIVFGALTGSGVALGWAGRALGGQGRVADAVVLVAWLQVVLLVLHVGLVVIALLLPPLTPLAILAVLGAFLWCLLGFAQALHGIGPGRALGAVLLAGLGFLLGVGALTAALGIEVPAHV